MTNLIDYSKAETYKAYCRASAALDRGDRETALISYGIGNANRKMIKELFGECVNLANIETVMVEVEEKLWP